MVNLGYIRQKLSIEDKIGHFISYLDFIGSIKVIDIAPRNQ